MEDGTCIAAAESTEIFRELKWEFIDDSLKKGRQSRSGKLSWGFETKVKGNENLFMRDNFEKEEASQEGNWDNVLAWSRLLGIVELG